MSNPAFSDRRVKIGKSQSDPSSFRKNELYSTGVPEPFVVEYYAFVEDYDNAERKIHATLSNIRPNKDREFFNISSPEAILKIRELCAIKHEEVFYRSPEEIKQIQKQQEAKLQRSPHELLEDWRKNEREKKEKQRKMEQERREKREKELDEFRKSPEGIKQKKLWEEHQKKLKRTEFWDSIFFSIYTFPIFLIIFLFCMSIYLILNP